MPVKHIPEATWRKVEKKMVELVVETKLPLKASEVLDLSLRIGLERLTAEEVYRLKSGSG